MNSATNHNNDKNNSDNTGDNSSDNRGARDVSNAARGEVPSPTSQTVAIQAVATQALADDALVDALLEAHHEEHSRAMEARLSKAFAAIDEDAANQHAPASLPYTAVRATESRDASRRDMLRRRFVRLARAALIALAFGAMFLLFPYETNASTLLDRALTAETSAAVAQGSRRYEVRVTLPARALANRGPNAPTELVGTWDLRGDEARLDLAAGPFGTTTRASSADGAWERSIDGNVRALDSRALWPRWIEDPSGEVAIERMDALLRLVRRSYIAVAARAGDESPAELRGSMHIVATRAERVLGPDDIDLWIDTKRNVVLAARLAWHTPPNAGRPLREGSLGEFREGARGEMREGARGEMREGARGEMREGPPGFRPPAPGGSFPPPPSFDEYQPARGMLPPFPPSELRLRRVEPIEFSAEHFAMPKK